MNFQLIWFFIFVGIVSRISLAIPYYSVVHEMIHKDSIWTTSFSENDQYLLTTSWDDHARLFDVQTGKLLFYVPNIYPDPAFFSITRLLLLLLLIKL